MRPERCERLYGTDALNFSAPGDDRGHGGRLRRVPRTISPRRRGVLLTRVSVGVRDEAAVINKGAETLIKVTSKIRENLGLTTEWQNKSSSRRGWLWPQEPWSCTFCVRLEIWDVCSSSSGGSVSFSEDLAVLRLWDRVCVCLIRRLIGMRSPRCSSAIFFTHPRLCRPHFALI